MKKYSSYLFFAVIIIAAFFRFYNLKSVPPGLYPDEAMNGSNALEAIETGQYKVFYPENNGREGLFINIQALFVKALGNHPWALRSASAVFGILTVIAVYLLGSALFKDKRVGLWSSFFCSVSFWHINFSRIGFRAIMAPFFLALACYFLIKTFSSLSENSAKGKSYLWLSVIGGFAYGLGFHSYIAYRATPLLILIAGLYFFIRERSAAVKKKIVVSFAIFTFSAIVAAAPLIAFFAKNPADFLGRTSQISIMSSSAPLKNLSLNIIKTLGMFNFVGDGNPRHNFASRPELSLPVGILFIAGTMILSKAIAGKRGKEDRFPAIFLASWMAIAFLPVVISNEGLPHALRAILMIPAVMIIAGFGAMKIYEKATKRFSPQIVKGAALGLCLFLTINSFTTYFEKWGRSEMTADSFAADYAKIADEINALPKETPKYVIVEAGGTSVRGIPMPSQTVMFLTDSFTKTGQNENKIFYFLSEEERSIPGGGKIFRIK